ncbi:hypothetical protein EON83_23370 [bacterium]|nr:MAG: hypothetical protein EON83_23370 [bacterium]
MSFSLLAFVHESLCFDETGVDCVSGLRRQRISYSDIKTVKMQKRMSRGGQVPAILIGTSAHRPPIEIYSYNYEAGTLGKILHILSQHAPEANWNDMAREYLNSRPFSG